MQDLIELVDASFARYGIKCLDAGSVAQATSPVPLEFCVFPAHNYGLTQPRDSDRLGANRSS
jgi:hypothetical protein